MRLVQPFFDYIKMFLISVSKNQSSFTSFPTV